MTKKIIRSTTVGSTLTTFCTGLLSQLKNLGYDVIALSSPDRDLEYYGEEEKIRTIGVSMERRMSPLKDAVALFRLICLFIQERPSMVHSMTPKAGLLCMVAAWMARVPVRIHTFTGLVWPTATGKTRELLKLTDKITCACATHVIPEGQGVLDELKKSDITQKSMKVLGYGNIRGVDLLYYSRRPEVLDKASLLRQDGVFRFVYIGRIVGDKGINELVNAFVKIEKLYPSKSVNLTLVGCYEETLDPVSTETRRIIETHTNIIVTGWLLGDAVLPYYAAADCFVFPSYREGFPNTVIEAGAMELPCIVTDINGSREIIANADYRNNNTNIRLQTGERMSVRENGVVIPSQDTEALRDAMLWMMEHPEERKKMGQRAREMVADRYEQSFVRQCLYDFYREVLG